MTEAFQLEGPPDRNRTLLYPSYKSRKDVVFSASIPRRLLSKVSEVVNVADVVPAALDNAKGLASSSEFATRREDAFEGLKGRPEVLWIKRYLGKYRN